MRELGGLFICGTERHESRRIDNQLRGRSGRQGDPGETRFFLSAEDDVIRLFAGDRIYKILDKLGPVDDEGEEMPLEAKMLTKTVENAQKKVEEQNFLIRKRVLEYDDVMNEQRRVVYKYRGEILEGRDMSDVARDELEGVIERLVDEYTPGDDLEDWDLPELDVQLRQIWPVGIDVAAMAPESVDREKLKDELDEDAMNAYDEREEKLAAQGGEDLMRQLERSILLQVIDNRWREHLYDMDYLREGIHLRGFAQIDPLVAYKNEGFGMFEELMHSIWEEFSKLVFHAEIEIEPGQAEGVFAGNGGGAEPTALDYSGGTSEGQPSALQQVAAGAGGVEMGGEVAPPRRRSATAPPSRSRPWSRTSTTKSAATTPAGAAAARSTRSATAPERAHGRLTTPVREFIRAFNERDLDAFVAVLDPEVELHSMRGLRKGVEAARLWATRKPGGRAADDRARAALRGRDRGRGRRRGRADRPPLALGRGRLGGRRRRDGLGLRAARPPDSQLAPLRGSRRGDARRRLRAARGIPERRTIRAVEPVAAANQEATDAWSGPLFERFAKFRDLVDGRPRRPRRRGDARPPAAAGRSRDRPRLRLRRHDAAARRAGRPRGRGGRGRRLRALHRAGAQGGRGRRRRTSSFAVADVQVGELGRGLRLRLLAHGADVLRQPGAGAAQHPLGAGAGRSPLRGRLAAQGGQRMGAPSGAGRRASTSSTPRRPTSRPAGPGPFSMANADTVTEQLKIAGFEQIALQRCDLPLKIGNDLDHAVEFNMALGPAGEVLRLWEDRIDEIRPKIARDLREALAEFEAPTGSIAPASTWIISATA